VPPKIFSAPSLLLPRNCVYSAREEVTLPILRLAENDLPTTSNPSDYAFTISIMFLRPTGRRIIIITETAIEL
jgi:hypothetical protein